MYLKILSYFFLVGVVLLTNFSYLFAEEKKIPLDASERKLLEQSRIEVPSHYIEAHDFEGEMASGKKASLADFSGKFLILNFWATWCPPCIAEMPNIQGLYSDLKEDEDIVFLMISLDQDPQKAADFMKRKGYDLPVYFPRSPKPRVYDTSVVPTTYVVDGNGYIVMKKRGMAQYNTKRFKEFLRAEPNQSVDVDL